MVKWNIIWTKLQVITVHWISFSLDKDIRKRLFKVEPIGKVKKSRWNDFVVYASRNDANNKFFLSNPDQKKRRRKQVNNIKEIEVLLYIYRFISRA